MSNIFKFKEIVDNEIKPVSINHPFYNQKIKDVFIKQFAKDMKIATNMINRVEKCNGLFNAVINNKNIYFYIEYIDGGGKNKFDNSNPHVKVSIPFGNKIFQDIIIDNIVFIVNLYVPYKSTGEMLEIDIENAVYLFVLPSEIFEAKGYKNTIYNKLNTTDEKKVNPSSRWVSLFKIKSCIIDQKILSNGKGNVSLIPKNLIENFINSKMKNEYEKWKIEKLMISLIEDKNETRKLEYVSNARRDFRVKLVNSVNPSTCQNINHNVFHETALRGSHILAVNKILKNPKLLISEKIHYISDINNGLLLCANCDALFDKYKFTIAKEGRVLIKHDIQEIEQIIGCKNGEKIISNDDYIVREKYLKFHQQTFKENN